MKRVIYFRPTSNDPLADRVIADADGKGPLKAGDELFLQDGTKVGTVLSFGAASGMAQITQITSSLAVAR